MHNYVRGIVMCIGIALFVVPLYVQAELPPVPSPTYPVLKASAPTASGFVPKGWKIESKKMGDLNKDGADDLVLVLRETNPVNILANTGMGVSVLDTNPRMLVVAFQEPLAQSYTLVLENHTLIPRHVIPTIDDPLAEDGISIARGSLRVHLHAWASAGSWSTSETIYTFRYDGKCMQVIGYDRDWRSRGTGATEIISVNYLTSRVKTIKRVSPEAQAETLQDTLKPATRLCLADIGDGLDFEPLP